VIWHLAREGVLCQGPGEQFVLVDDWIRGHHRYDRDEALGELARRYFTSHGPATLADLSRWVKLPQRDLKVGVAVAGTQLAVHAGMYMAPELAVPRSAATSCVLLPGFDELVLGYDDRTATLDRAHEPRIVPGGNGVFRATVVAGGRVVGTWKRIAKARENIVEPALWAAPPRGLASAVVAYGRFLGKPTRLER
jgi:hypothetical protein